MLFLRQRWRSAEWHPLIFRIWIRLELPGPRGPGSSSRIQMLRFGALSIVSAPFSIVSAPFKISIVSAPFRSFSAPFSIVSAPFSIVSVLNLQMTPERPESTLNKLALLITLQGPRLRQWPSKRSKTTPKRSKMAGLPKARFELSFWIETVPGDPQTFSNSPLLPSQSQTANETQTTENELKTTETDWKQPKTTENEPKTTENEPKTIENDPENDRKRRRSKTAPKWSIWIRFELQGPPKGPAARIEFKC